MTDEPLYPLALRPVYKERIWGGRNLARLLRKDLPEGVAIGESWEIGDDSKIANGPLAGQRLAALAAARGRSLLGSLAADRSGTVFPLLVKLIDAQDRLSVQVHPDDDYARRVEGVAFGKTEAWYVLDAAEGAEVIHGIAAEGLGPGELAALVRDGRLVEHLSRVPVRPGDVIFIPAGTVHAMGDGLLICEVQQNCDVTYRFYDWDRRDARGRPRPLHIAQAVAVARPGPREHKIPPVIVERPYGRQRPLVACRYFAVDLFELATSVNRIADGRSFVTLSILDGRGEVAWRGGSVEAHSGDSLLIPATVGEYELRPVGGTWRLLTARVPDLAVDVVQPLREAGVGREDILRLGGPIETNDLVDLLR